MTRSRRSPHVALVLIAVGDLSGSGGTERQFADLFDHVRRMQPGSFTLVTTRAALDRLQATGRVADGGDIMVIGGGPAVSGRLAILRLTCALAWATITHGWDVVHLCQPTPIYVPYAALMTALPRSTRPRITLTVVDCTLAHRLRSPGEGDRYEQQVVEAHRLYFDWVRLDGVFSWYRLFVDVAKSARLLPERALLSAARYCFTNTSRFAPAPLKEPLVVYAGRLSEQKRPLLFVDAVSRLVDRHGEAAAGWKFEMYGRGPLEDAVRSRIRERGLDRVLTLTHAPDLSTVFARSKLFVSTQAYENFTSLAMLEAMAAGNAVIAEAVGQTTEFVRSGNGYAVGSSADEFADAMADYFRHPGRHAAMAAESRAVATEVHNIENFSADIGRFWADVSLR